MKIDWKKSVIILSGGFAPIHKGHMRMFREAANLGHQVIVGLNSDEWLTRKKGKPFMEFSIGNTIHSTASCYRNIFNFCF